MEKMPYRAELDCLPVQISARAMPSSAAEQLTSDWRQGLPMLAGRQVVMRELRASDAPSLFALLTTEEVSRFISPPPTTVEGFERFVAWAQRQRRRRLRVLRRHGCGFDTAIGIFQIRDLGRGFGRPSGASRLIAVLGPGVFGRRGQARGRLRVRHARRGAPRSARRSERTRQRAPAEDWRRRQCLLRKSFHHGDEYLDQMLYAILDVDWHGTRTLACPPVVLH
jgi:RimJ/RimL family protein N-acetyltransferase